MSKNRKEDVNLTGRLGIFEEISQQSSSINNDIKPKEKEENDHKSNNQKYDTPRLVGINILVTPKLHEDFKIHCVKIGWRIKERIRFFIEQDLKNK